MNKDQMKGKAKDIAGKAQEKMGDLTDNDSQKFKGKAKQVEGKVQEGFGDVKDAVDNASNDEENKE